MDEPYIELVVLSHCSCNNRKTQSTVLEFARFQVTYVLVRNIIPGTVSTVCVRVRVRYGYPEVRLVSFQFLEKTDRVM